MPKVFNKILKPRGTPWTATLLVMAVSVIFTLLGDIELVASITNVMIFVVFFAVNLALIVIQLKNEANDEKVFKIPLRIRNVPITAILGAATSVIMLLQFDVLIIAISSLVTLIGIVIYWVVNRSNQNRKKP